MGAYGLADRLAVWALSLVAHHWRGLCLFGLGALAGGAVR